MSYALANKTKDHNINYKSIICEQIPVSFENREEAKRYFSQFGTIKRFVQRSGRASCIVDYTDEAGAARAMREGGQFNGHQFVIKYAKLEEAHVRNTAEHWVEAEVRSELEAMSGGSASPLTSKTVGLMMAPPAPAQTSKLSTRAQKLPTSTPLKTRSAGGSVSTAVNKKITESTIAELEAIMRQPATCNEEKYRILDARDKLIRYTKKQTADIKNVLKGTCPDMCPEKERLMRECQRQLSIYETDRATASLAHERVVKTYARSSADQEVPLDHELRPENVLQMTMSYLLHRIIPLSEDRSTVLGEWFNFVWERLRSIRKDITQQALCSLTSVELIEQCARFHIHCAARLVDEDSSVFDKKINAENLTNCLQTLKYMYSDLRLKGIECPCEVEFRSYIILLNLKDANFLWEVNQLPEHIYNAPEIRQAMSFANALQVNNYVRFFRMMASPQTSYLSACILLGYCTTLRRVALERMVRAHCWGKKVATLPLAHVMSMLKFEDEDATANFCMYYGLECDNEKVTLNRLTIPTGEYKMERAIKLVESKMTTSAVECISGRALTTELFENHVPHNSFNEKGLLKPEAWMAEDQLSPEALMDKIHEEELVELPIKNKERLDEIEEFREQEKEQAASMENMADVAEGVVKEGEPTEMMNNHDQRPAFTVPVSRIQEDLNMEMSRQRQTSTSSMPPPVGNILDTQTKETAHKTAPPFSFVTPEVPRTVATKALSHLSAPTQAPVESNWSGNLFGSPGGTANKVASPGNALFTGSNIFGMAAKETANLFPTFSTCKEVKSNVVPSAVGVFGPPFNPPTAEVLPQPPAQPDHAERLLKEIREDQERNRIKLEAEKKRLRELEEEHERLKQEAKRQRDLEKLERQAQEDCTNLIDEVVKSEIERLALEELHRHQSLDKRTEELFQEIFEQCTNEVIQNVAMEEFVAQSHDQCIMQRFFNKWRANVRRNIEEKLALELTPQWVVATTLPDIAAKLQHPHMEENLQLIKRYRHGAPCDFSKLLWENNKDFEECKLNLHEIIARELAVASADQPEGALPARKYFKLLISLPDEIDELLGFESLSNEWLTKYIDRSANGPATEAFICGVQHELALCVRKFAGISPLNEVGLPVCEEWHNADAVIVLMTPTNLRNTNERLQYLLNHAKMLKNVPFAFIAYDSSRESDLCLGEALDVESLLLQGRIAYYTFLGCGERRSEFKFVRHFYQALRLLTRASVRLNAELKQYEMQSVQSFLDTCLGQEMWIRWENSSMENLAFRKISTSPQHVLVLYNEVLKRLERMANDIDLEAAEFPEELRPFVLPIPGDIPKGLPYFPKDWKDPKRQEQLVAFLRKLELPPLSQSDVRKMPFQDFEQLKLWLINYASRCLSHPLHSAAAAHEAIGVAVQQLQEKSLDTKEGLTVLNFLAVLKPIIYAMAREIVLQEGLKLPHEIIYERESLHEYQTRPWWLHIDLVASVSVDYSQGLLEVADEENNNCNNSADRELMEELIKQAEEISAAYERRRLAASRKRQCDNESRRRSLEQSFYEFQAGHQLGVCKAGEVPFEDRQARESDTRDMTTTSSSPVKHQPNARSALSSVAHNNSLEGQKRKRLIAKEDEDLEKSSDAFEKTINRAWNLIKELDDKEDLRSKLECSMQLSDHNGSSLEDINI